MELVQVVDQATYTAHIFNHCAGVIQESTLGILS